MKGIKTVVKIDANPILAKQRNDPDSLRVAAYCRVSTDKDDQVESYKAQVAHYTEAISRNPRWQLVDIYADEGITGTIDKKRPNFMRMIRDCKKRKIDLIITKAVARFARNTVDSLNYVRKLKAQGVGVYFEEQNINSMQADSEMMIGLYSVLAQGESENISANVRWGIQQRMKSGTYAFRYNLLGYRKGEDGEPEIVPEEAETIQAIYNKFLDGESVAQIKRELETAGYKTFRGKTKWSEHIIRSILTNERYTGDMLLQKTYIENCITKKSKKNRGELPKYLILNNHPAIISKDVFKRVQAEFSRRGNLRPLAEETITGKGKYSGKYVLSDILVCGECGSHYRRRIWTEGGKTRAVWRCLNRIQHGVDSCPHSLTVSEKALHEAINKAIKKAIDTKDSLELIIANLSYAVTGDDNALDIFAIENEIKSLGEANIALIEQMRTTDGDKKKYVDELMRVNGKIKLLREQLRTAKEILLANDNKKAQIENIKQEIMDIDLDDIDNMSDELVYRKLLESVRVLTNKTIEVRFKGGIVMQEALQYKQSTD